jgi:hypothetical protein
MVNLHNKIITHLLQLFPAAITNYTFSDMTGISTNIQGMQ